MSAIAGIWFFEDRPVTTDYMDLLKRPLSHRGPDGINIWRNGNKGFLHCMMHTTPESTYESLPYSEPLNRWVITSDSRLDNREELFSRLDMKFDPAIPDSFLIVEAYKAWKEKCIDYLLGDFVFVVYDRMRQSMFCARDQFGVKPFYYVHTSRLFAFASELRAIAALPGVSGAINDVHVANLLLPNLDDRESTCYANIRKLPAATTLHVTPASCEKNEYWKLDPSRELPRASDEEYIAELRSVFTRAVKRRTRSIHPVGSTLSGGLDSSSNVAIARKGADELFPGSLNTLSVLYPGRRYDESEYINAVVEQGQISAHFIDGNAIRPLAALSPTIQQVGQLFYGPNVCIHLALFELAQSKGVRTLLDGFDGDSTLCHGVDRISHLARQGHLRLAVRESNALAVRFGSDPYRVLLKQVVAPALPEPLKRVVRSTRKRSSAPLLPPFISTDLAKRVDLEERLRSTAGVAVRRTPKENHHKSLMRGVFPNVFEIADVLSHAYGMKLLYPYCDIELVQFCLDMPDDLKLRDGWTRYAMHKAMSELPGSVRWRPTKTDVSYVLTTGMHQWDRDLLKVLVGNVENISSDYIDSGYIRNVYNRYVVNPEPGDAMLLWKAAALTIWLQETGTHG